MAALDRTVAEFRTDPDRGYLTGPSMGGNGTSRFIIPADSGEAFAALARRVGRLPTWIFHGEIDPVVAVSESRRAAEALRAAGGNVRYTEFLGGGHNVWDGTYASPQFQEWLFAQRRAR